MVLDLHLLIDTRLQGFDSNFHASALSFSLTGQSNILSTFAPLFYANDFLISPVVTAKILECMNSTKYFKLILSVP